MARPDSGYRGHPQPVNAPRAIAATAAFVAVVVALYALDPRQVHWLPPCPFHWATGYYCPGCGALRCLHQLAHGNIVGAWRLNPLIVLCMPILLHALAAEVSPVVLKRRLRPIAVSGRA